MQLLEIPSGVGVRSLPFMDISPLSPSKKPAILFQWIGLRLSSSPEWSAVYLLSWLRVWQLGKCTPSRTEGDRRQRIKKHIWLCYIFTSFLLTHPRKFCSEDFAVPEGRRQLGRLSWKCLTWASHPSAHWTHLTPTTCSRVTPSDTVEITNDVYYWVGFIFLQWLNFMIFIICSS